MIRYTSFSPFNPPHKRKNKPSLSYLKRVSQTWTEAQWENYLTSIEGPLREKLYYDLDKLAETSEHHAPEYFHEGESQELPPFAESDRAAVRFLLRSLSPMEKKVVKFMYWKGLSDSEIAVKLRASRRSIRTHLERALLKLRVLLSPPLPIRGGESLLARHETRQKRVKPATPIPSCSQFFEKKRNLF